MNKFPIIVDTDPGLDDAVALAVVSAFCKKELVAVISSYGNVNVDITTKNVLDLLKLFEVEEDVTVIKGCTNPLGSKTFEDAPHIHGANGLGGLQIENSDKELVDTNSIEALYELVIKNKKVDYITLGPMTNLATLIETYPDVVQYINRVVTMGGAFSMGNVTPYAEFNIYCDPQACNICFDSDVKITIVPLNTTHQVALSLEEIEEICRCDGPSRVNEIIKQILDANYYSNVADGDQGSIVHDATAVLYYLFPEIFTTCAKMDIATRIGGERIGQTIEMGNKPNVLVTTNINKELAMEKLKLAIARF